MIHKPTMIEFIFWFIFLLILLFVLGVVSLVVGTLLDHSVKAAL